MVLRQAVEARARCATAMLRLAMVRAQVRRIGISNRAASFYSFRGEERESTFVQREESEEGRVVWGTLPTPNMRDS